jgi:hypothetical protein
MRDKLYISKSLIYTIRLNHILFTSFNVIIISQITDHSNETTNTLKIEDFLVNFTKIFLTLRCRKQQCKYNILVNYYTSLK